MQPLALVEGLFDCQPQAGQMSQRKIGRCTTETVRQAAAGIPVIFLQHAAQLLHQHSLLGEKTLNCLTHLHRPAPQARAALPVE